MIHLLMFYKTNFAAARNRSLQAKLIEETSNPFSNGAKEIQEAYMLH